MANENMAKVYNALRVFNLIEVMLFIILSKTSIELAFPVYNSG